MPRARVNGSLADQEAVQPLRAAGMTFRQIAAELGWSYHRVSEADRALRGVPSDNSRFRTAAYRERLASAEAEAAPLAEEAPKDEAAPEGKRKPIRISKVATRVLNAPLGQVHRFIVTAAQDDCPVFKPFWDNLLAYAAFLDANVAVGGYTYQLGLFEDHTVATGVYDEALRPYLEFGRTQITPDLLHVADANVLPTAPNPLAGWATVNHGNHVIIPHARRAFETLKRMPGEPPRYLMSTGCVTEPSYTPRASGRKALFHHTYGAILVEVDVDGECFFHELSAEDDGSFQHLSTRVENGVVSHHHPVEALVLGDDHHANMDPAIALRTWGIDIRTNETVTDDNLIDILRPRHQVHHDVLDFRRRNHHDRGCVFARAKMLAAGTTNVEDEVLAAARFLVATARPWCKTHQVESNHDDALTRWVKDLKAGEDEENSYYHAMLRARALSAIRRREDFHVVQHAMAEEPGYSNVVNFVRYGKGLRIAGSQCGLHGDKGAGGSRGSPRQFRNLGEKVCSAHTHSPFILDGVYVAGVSASLLQGYNEDGIGSWAHAHIVIYPSGKRALLLLAPDGRAWAEGELEAVDEAMPLAA